MFCSDELPHFISRPSLVSILLRLPTQRPLTLGTQVHTNDPGISSLPLAGTETERQAENVHAPEQYPGASASRSTTILSSETDTRHSPLTSSRGPNNRTRNPKLSENKTITDDHLSI